MPRGDSLEGEETEEEDESEGSPGHDHIVFLVDARASMRPHLLACLQLALQVAKAKIIASDHSSIGVIFFGTRQKNEDSESCPDNVFTLLALDPPSASRIRTLMVIPIASLDMFHSRFRHSRDLWSPSMRELVR